MQPNKATKKNPKLTKPNIKTSFVKFQTVSKHQRNSFAKIYDHKFQEVGEIVFQN